MREIITAIIKEKERLSFISDLTSSDVFPKLSKLWSLVDNLEISLKLELQKELFTYNDQGEVKMKCTACGHIQHSNVHSALSALAEEITLYCDWCGDGKLEAG